jgi:hypothetical protein
MRERRKKSQLTSLRNDNLPPERYWPHSRRLEFSLFSMIHYCGSHRAESQWDHGKVSELNRSCPSHVSPWTLVVFGRCSYETVMPRKKGFSLWMGVVEGDPKKHWYLMCICAFEVRTR